VTLGNRNEGPVSSATRPTLVALPRQILCGYSPSSGWAEDGTIVGAEEGKVMGLKQQGQTLTEEDLTQNPI